MSASSRELTHPSDHQAYSTQDDYKTITMVSVAHGLTHFFHLLLPPLFPLLVNELHLSYTRLGLLMTVFFIVSGCGQFASGFVVHRFGPVRVLYVGMCLLIGAGLSIYFATGYPMLLLSVVFSGLGNAVIHPVNYSIINFRINPANLGHAFSTHSIAGIIGWAIAPPLVIAVSNRTNWHDAGLFAALLVSVVLLVLIWKRRLIRVEQAPDTHQDHTKATGKRLSFLRNPVVWFSFSYFFLSNAAFGTLQNYAIPLLKHYYGLSLYAASICMAVYLVGNGLGVIAGGFLASKQIAHQKPVAISLSASAILALFLASELLPAWLIFILLPCMGFSMGVAGPFRHLMARFAANSKRVTDCQSCVYGFVYAGQDAGISLTPLWVGPLMDHHHYMAVFLCVVALQGAAVLAALLETSKKHRFNGSLSS